MLKYEWTYTYWSFFCDGLVTLIESYRHTHILKSNFFQEIWYRNPSNLSKLSFCSEYLWLSFIQIAIWIHRTEQLSKMVHLLDDFILIYLLKMVNVHTKLLNYSRSIPVKTPSPHSLPPLPRAQCWFMARRHWTSLPRLPRWCLHHHFMGGPSIEILCVFCARNLKGSRRIKADWFTFICFFMNICLWLFGCKKRDLF